MSYKVTRYHVLVDYATDRRTDHVKDLDRAGAREQVCLAAARKGWRRIAVEKVEFRGGRVQSTEVIEEYYPEEQKAELGLPLPISARAYRGASMRFPVCFDDLRGSG